MARIYNQENYQGLYEGSAKSVAFNPVKAVDLSQREKQRGQERIRDAQTMGRAAARQYELDKSRIAYEGAQRMGQAKIQGQAFQALLGLSKTAMSTFQEIERNNRITEEEDAILASIGKLALLRALV